VLDSKSSEISTEPSPPELVVLELLELELLELELLELELLELELLELELEELELEELELLELEEELEPPPQASPVTVGISASFPLLVP